jgi:hypothetical protein
MRPPVFVIACCALFGFAGVAQAGRIIYVNGTTGNNLWTGLCRTHTSGTCGPKKTIQAGIDASASGDTVLVANGTYTGAGNLQMSYGGRLITLRSENGPEVCTVDGGGADIKFFDFNTNEGPEAVLDGFTLTRTSMC